MCAPSTEHVGSLWPAVADGLDEMFGDALQGTGIAKAPHNGGLDSQAFEGMKSAQTLRESLESGIAAKIKEGNIP